MSQALSLTGRYLNAACYLVSGIFLLAMQSSHSSAWGVVIGVASIAYGGYIGLTRRSYWVSTYAYLIPIILIAVAFAH